MTHCKRGCAVDSAEPLPAFVQKVDGCKVDAAECAMAVPSASEWSGREISLQLKGAPDVIKGVVYSLHEPSDTLVLKENAVGQVAAPS
jgi:hypothetical protein